MISRPWILLETTLLVGWAVMVAGLFAVVGTLGSQVLHFRLPESQVVHLPNERAAQLYGDSLNSLGFASSLRSHHNHTDVSVSASTWLKAEFNTGFHLEQWKRWLDSMGFETKRCSWR